MMGLLGTEAQGDSHHLYRRVVSSKGSSSPSYSSKLVCTVKTASVYRSNPPVRKTVYRGNWLFITMGAQVYEMATIQTPGM